MDFRKSKVSSLVIVILAVGIAALHIGCALAAPSATPTPAPRPTTQGGPDPASLRQRFQDWPEGYKFAVDEDIVVRLAHPSPMFDWAGFAFIDHIPSASSVTLARPFSVVGPNGAASPGHTQNIETIAGEELVVHRHYQSEPGQVRLEQVLADEELVRGIVALGRRALPQGWPQAGPTYVGSPTPQPEGPEVVGRIMGPPIPQLGESEKTRALAIVQADPIIQDVLQGKPYSVSEYAVWHSGSGRKIGVGIRITPEQPYWVEYDWPVLEFDEAKYDFPHYRENTIRGGLMVKDLYVRVDLLSGRMVAISPSD